MRPREPGQINVSEHCGPPCPRCDGLMALASIEPAQEEDHDLRTFACEACGQSEVVKITFR